MVDIPGHETKTDESPDVINITAYLLHICQHGRKIIHVLFEWHLNKPLLLSD